MGFNFSTARQVSRVPTPPPETVDTPPPTDTGLSADAEPPLAKTLYEQELEPLQAAVTEAEAKVKQEEKAARAGPPIRGHYTEALHEKKEGERPVLDVRREGQKLTGAQEELQAAVSALEKVRLADTPAGFQGLTKYAFTLPGHGPGKAYPEVPRDPSVAGAKLQAPLPISTDPSEAPSKVQRAFSDYLASTGRGRGLDTEQMSEEFMNFRLARAKDRLFDPNPEKGNHSLITVKRQIDKLTGEMDELKQDVFRTPSHDTLMAVKALTEEIQRAVALYDQMSRIAQTQIGMTPDDIDKARSDAIKAAEQGVSLEAYQAKVAAERAEAEKAKAEKARAEASQ